MTELGRRYNVNETAIRSIRKSKDKIWYSVRESVSESAKIVSVCKREPLLEKMENYQRGELHRR